MKVIYTARHTTITPDIKEYCEKRVKSLEKLIGHSIDADVLLSVEKYRHKVEINLKTKMASFNTVEETHDMTSSLVGAFDHLEKRVKKGREKLRERKTTWADELVIVDSFSTDKTPEIAQKYATRFEQHLYIAHSFRHNLIEK